MRKRAVRAFAAVVTLLATYNLSAQQRPSSSAFAYSGDKGPGFWDEINRACAATPSAHQSPIDLRGAVPDPGLKPLHLILSGTTYELTDTGYTVNAVPQSLQTLIFGGVAYDLQQFHFHTLSEHTVAEKHGDMELHAVFHDSATNHFVVIGVLYELGHADPFLRNVLRNGLPLQTTSAPITTEELDLQHALTDTSAYYTYPGSLTTPPCREDVTWIVLKHWAQLSPSQFEAFRHTLGNDFRPTQQLNGRVIRETTR